MKLFEWEKFEHSREWEEKLQIVFFIPLTVLTSFGYPSRLRSERRPKWNYLLITLDSRLVFFLSVDAPPARIFRVPKKEQSDIVVIIKIMYTNENWGLIWLTEKKKHVAARKFKFSWDSPEGCRAVQQQTCRCRERIYMQLSCGRKWRKFSTFPFFASSPFHFAELFNRFSGTSRWCASTKCVSALWSAFICSSHHHCWADDNRAIDLWLVFSISLTPTTARKPNTPSNSKKPNPTWPTFVALSPTDSTQSLLFLFLCFSMHFLGVYLKAVTCVLTQWHSTICCHCSVCAGNHTKVFTQTRWVGVSVAKLTHQLQREKSTR